MLKVLIAEDDLIIADMVEDQLLADGMIVCGIATNIAEAIALTIAHQPDCAIVDVRLADGDLGTDLAVSLKQLQTIGILYATANLGLVMKAQQNPTYRGVIGEACVMKPYNFAKIAVALHIVDDLSRTGVTARASPEGLFILALADPSI